MLGQRGRSEESIHVGKRRQSHGRLVIYRETGQISKYNIKDNGSHASHCLKSIANTKMENGL